MWIVDNNKSRKIIMCEGGGEKRGEWQFVNNNFSNIVSCRCVCVCGTLWASTKKMSLLCLFESCTFARFVEEKKKKTSKFWINQSGVGVCVKCESTGSISKIKISLCSNNNNEDNKDEETPLGHCRAPGRGRGGGKRWESTWNESLNSVVVVVEFQRRMSSRDGNGW